MAEKRPDVRDILKKYEAKLSSQINNSVKDNGSYSREYVEFKEELSPELSRYERWCTSLGSIIKINTSKKDEDEIKKYLKIAHLNVEPWQALTLSVMTFFFTFLFGFFISLAITFVNGIGSNIVDVFTTGFPFLFFFLSIIVSLFLFYFVKGYPQRLANAWRLKASSQMVPAILYTVVYMRHTPNLEKAISFAANNLDYPLALDFKKIFYDVEVGRFSTIKESLDNYLDTWRDYSIEFIEAFHLIEGSLFEPDDSRRIGILEKSLQVVLDGVYDKMLKFTHNVRTPLTNVYMLGVVLPTLGLALLPLASSMLGGILKWYHVIVLFNLIIPFFVFYLTDKIVFLRPGGYGESKLLERNPLYGEYKSKKHYFNAFVLAFPFLIIGLLPLVFHYTPLPHVLGLQQDYTFSEMGLSIFGDEKFFGYSDDGKGPFGIGSLILGMFLPLGTAVFFTVAYRDKTRGLILERNKTKELESEFNNSLFQLGNRIGNGSPPEIAFGNVAESSIGLKTEDFFRRVNYNIRQMGMSLEKAIFDKRRGTLVYYPSDLIATSMKILVESSKKGLKIAAMSLISISEYVKNIDKITQRLKDMLAEIASDMKSNMAFLAPLLSGIVVGLAAMITSILSKLSIISNIDSVSVGFDLKSILDIFDVSLMVPPYFLQISIGIYLIQIIFILTRTLVTIDSGEDKLEKTNKTGLNIKGGITLYFVTALLSTIALFILSSFVLKGLT